MGRKFPCDKCGKILASRCMLRAHQPACIQGKSIQCPDCGKQYTSRQGMRQHHKVAHGVDRPEADETFPCPYSQKNFSIQKSMREHSYVCSSNHARKGALLLKGPWLCEGRAPLQPNEEPQCSSLWHPQVGREEGLKYWSWPKVTGHLAALVGC